MKSSFITNSQTEYKDTRLLLLFLTKSRKLVTSLENKEGLICDYRTLKQAMQHGLKLKGIECAIKYEQKAWLKPYIDLNTKLRQEGTSELEKDFFKLMNNAVYGKKLKTY